MSQTIAVTVKGFSVTECITEAAVEAALQEAIKTSITGIKNDAKKP